MMERLLLAAGIPRVDFFTHISPVGSVWMLRDPRLRRRCTREVTGSGKPQRSDGSPAAICRCSALPAPCGRWFGTWQTDGTRWIRLSALLCSHRSPAIRGVLTFSHLTLWSSKIALFSYLSSIRAELLSQFTGNFSLSRNGKSKHAGVNGHPRSSVC